MIPAPSLIYSLKGMLHSCNIPFIILYRMMRRGTVYVKRDIKTGKEDYLSLMYEMKRKENQIVKSDLSRELEVPLSRVTRVTDGLLEEGYLLKGRRKKNVLNADGIIQRAAMSGKKTMPYRVSAFGFWVLMEVLQKKMHVRSNMFWMNAF